MNTNLLTWLIAFSLGALVSAVAFLYVQKPAPVAVPLSSSPLMDALNQYNCRIAETKHIIMGGYEDEYAPGNEEINSPGSLRDFMVSRTGSRGSVAVTRGYDEAGHDNAFLERFDNFPTGLAHGFVAIRLKPLGRLNNDSITIGQLEDGDNLSHVSGFGFANLDLNPWWHWDADILYAHLSELPFRTYFYSDGRPKPSRHDTVLSYIKEGLHPVDFIIKDDTMVDAIGFALCTEPKTKAGNTFLVKPLSDTILALSCNPLDGGLDHCNRYAGDTVCSQALPLACFREGEDSIPDGVSKTNKFIWSWTGGTLKFTEPIQGNSLKSQADGHALCQSRFGTDYRMSNTHDGFQSQSISAYGTPPQSETVWVDSNLEPYGNCWPRPSDYVELSDG